MSDKNYIISSEESTDTSNMPIRAQITSGSESHTNPSVVIQNPVVETSKVLEEERTEDSVKVSSFKKKRLSGCKRRKLKKARTLGLLIQPENKESIKKQHSAGEGISHNIESVRLQPPLGGGISHLVAERRRVTIVPDNYPQTVLTSEQSDEITGYIMYRINTLDPNGDVHPRFDGMSQQFGGCVINCLDDTTRVWVEEEVRGLELTCGIKLRTTSISSLRKTVKAGALFPGRVRSNTEFLMILKIQNPDINFKKWKIRDKKEEEGGIFITFDLPQAVGRTLGSFGRLICYGLRRVNLRVFEKEDYRLPPSGYHFGCPRNIVKRNQNIDDV